VFEVFSIFVHILPSIFSRKSEAKGDKMLEYHIKYNKLCNTMIHYEILSPNKPVFVLSHFVCL